MQTAALLFEFVPLDVFFCLSEVEDVKTRLNAISNLYCLTYDYVQEFNKLQNLRNRQLLKQLSENINYFLLFLQQLLEDTNFHIVITTLNIIQMLVEHLPKTVLKQNRETLLSTTLKLLGDQKNVIYQSIVDICLLLVNVLPGRFVISCLAEQTAGKQPNVRQNALCVLKSLLLQIPNLDLDQHELCKKLAPTVFDVIPQVRFSGLECLVVVARCIQQRRQNKVEEENYSSFFEAFLQGVPVSVEQADKTAAILCLQQRLAWYDLPCPVLQGSILMPGQPTNPLSSSSSSSSPSPNSAAAAVFFSSFFYFFLIFFFSYFTSKNPTTILLAD
nr:unnamed protein product [Spirometra erinaceieuropaei]